MSTTARPHACFHERDAGAPLWRRALVEGLGTALLVLAAVGAGLAAARIAPDTPGVAPLAIALVVGGALASLIVAFGDVSGGHFNPLITVLQWLARERAGACTAGYVAAQLAGGLAGSAFAVALFDAGRWPAPIPAAFAPGHACSECACAASLMAIVFACARSERVQAGPFAVGGWVMAAIVATPSGCYANPAVAFGALVARGPLALPPRDVAAYIGAELVGALLALLFVRAVWPTASRASGSTA